MKKQQTAILYARASDGENETDKDFLKEQVKQLKNYCRRKKIKVLGTYTEVKTGVHFNRKEFEKLLKQIQAKKPKVDLLLFTSWDRFCLYYKPTVEMVYTLIELEVKPFAISNWQFSEEFYKGAIASLKQNKKEKK